MTFNGPVSQVLAGDGSTLPCTGSGITITDVNGQPIPIIDSRARGRGPWHEHADALASPVPEWSARHLPAGNYQLNFVGNGIIANGRAVDVATTAHRSTAFREFEFTVTPTSPATTTVQGQVDGFDFLPWQRQLGGPGGADGNGSGTVDGPDLGIWQDNYGEPGAVAASVNEVAAAVVAGDRDSSRFGIGPRRAGPG